MCRAKKEENNVAAPLRSVSGEVFATFASLLLVALVLMCMLQTGLSCAYFAQERKSALTAVLDGATAMAETYASEGNIVTLPGGDNEFGKSCVIQSQMMRAQPLMIKEKM